ncbi:unnamed protein product [Parajaminaea phylloscopi]
MGDIAAHDGDGSASASELGHEAAPASRTGTDEASTAQPKRAVDISKRWSAQSGRQPQIVRPEASHSPLASPNYAPPKHHHHQRSRSVNLSPVMRGGSFAPPSISPGSGVNLSLAWENVPGADPRKRASSPLNLGGPLRLPPSRTSPGPSSSTKSQEQGHLAPHNASSPQLGTSPQYSAADVPPSRSPDQLRRSSREQIVAPHAKKGEGLAAHRTASPARAFAMPLSPRLQAFSSDRMRRSSSSSSNSSNGSDKGGIGSASADLHRTASPVLGPINPDPEHAYDSVWPAAHDTASPSSSPNKMRRGPELLHTWMMDRRSRSRSPSSVDGVEGFTSGSPRGTLEGVSPTFSRGAGPFGRVASGHRRSLSGSSGGSSASPPTLHPTTSSPQLRRFGLPEASVHRGESAARTAAESRTEQGLQRAASAPLPDDVAIERGSPLSRMISPTTSSVKVDAQSVLAQVTPSGEAAQDASVDDDGSVDDGKVVRRRSSGSNHRGINGIKRRSLLESPSSFERLGSSPSSASPSTSLPSPLWNATLRASPSPPPLSFSGPSESPPKTRSFIGMPPRSGYELSDDPDDVGSEDGTSSSVSSGGKEDSGSVTTDDEEERQQRDGYMEEEEDGERSSRSRDEDDGETLDDDGREVEAFTADEEDTEAARSRASDDPSTTLGSDYSSSLPALGAAQRPHLPKRPSLTRSAVVGPPPASPAQAQGLNALQYFQQDAGPSSPNDRSLWRSDEVGDEQEDGNDALLDGIAIPGESELDELADENGLDDEQRDEESLSTLERIFLFAKSEMTYHRIIVSRSLPLWIRDVELSEAVEYVIALLNGLATDDAEVCTAFASELHEIIWFFFLNCPLEGSDESDHQEDRSMSDASGHSTDIQKEQRETATRPRLPVSVFTPLICALLLNSNASVAQTAQSSLVTFFTFLRKADNEDGDLREGLVTQRAGREGEMVDYDEYVFNEAAKRRVADELLEHVAFAIGKVHARQSTDDESVPLSGNDSGSATPKQVSHPMVSSQDEESSWDAEMGQDGNDALLNPSAGLGDAWAKEASPFDSSSPVFSAYDDRTDVDEEAAVGRMASVSLLGALCAEPDAIESGIVSARFVPAVLALQDDAAFYVRKEVAVALAALSKHLGEDEVVQKLLPSYVKLSQDKIWHVRQAAVASLPTIFENVQGQRRRASVVDLMRSFIGDVSRAVRLAALEIIGQTIYLFEKDEAGVPQELLRFFLAEPYDTPDAIDYKDGDPVDSEQTDSPSHDSFLYADFGFGQAMGGAGSSRNPAQADPAAAPWGTGQRNGAGGFGRGADGHIPFDEPERSLIMAYNFPAVVLSSGGTDEWARLRQAHLDLTCDPSTKVRQSLSASLHEIAKLVGPAATEQDILPIMDRFLTEDEDGEVRLAAVEHVHVILRQLDNKSVALSKLALLQDLWSTTFAADWRLRQALALQIPALADDFVLLDEDGCLMSIMQMALGDPVSSVREAGVQATPAIYRNFAEHDQTIADGVLGMLSDMGEASSYRARVGFLLATYALCDDPAASKIQRSSFHLILLPRLAALVNDPVVDVRMALSKVVGRMCQLDELFAAPQSRSPDLLELLDSLARDSSEYVRARVRDAFQADDPILQATPRSVNLERRDLTLGPADGGPHRPDPSSDDESDAFNGGDNGFDSGMEEDQHGMSGSSPPSMITMDFDDDGPEGGQGEHVFGIPEDGGGLSGFSRFRPGQASGDDEDEEDDDLDSDLEMVNLDEAGDSADALSDPTTLDKRSDAAAAHEVQGHNVLGFAANGYDADGAAGDESFESIASSEGDGAEASVLYLTSPERPRPAFFSVHDSGMHDWDSQDTRQPSMVTLPYNRDEGASSGTHTSSHTGSRDAAGKDSGASSSEDSGTGDGARAGSPVNSSETASVVPNGQEQPPANGENSGAVPPASDPFLSFVSSSLGTGDKDKKAKRRKGLVQPSEPLATSNGTNGAALTASQEHLSAHSERSSEAAVKSANDRSEGVESS